MSFISISIVLSKNQNKKISFHDNKLIFFILVFSQVNNFYPRNNGDN